MKLSVLALAATTITQVYAYPIDLVHFAALAFQKIENEITGIPIPSNDPFYSAPSNLSDYKLGEVIRTRPVDMPLFTGLKGSWHILFRSENTFGSPIAAASTIFVPSDNSKGSDKFVSYQHYEDAAFIGCAPSYQFRGVPGPEIQILIDNGYIVSTPDHEGPESAFTAGILEGKITLDSIIAAKQTTGVTGLQDNADVAMWGYSGGSIATGWAAELQQTYAPGLKILGATMGGVVSNITAVAFNNNEKFTSGLVAGGVNGLTNEYPVIQNLFNTILKPEFQDFNDVKSQCIIGDVVQFPFQNIFNYWEGGASVFYEPAIAEILDSLTMGKSSPDFPFFIYQGIEDEIVPVGIVDELVSAWADAGAAISYAKDPAGFHITTQIFGLSGAVQFLNQLFADNVKIEGTKTTTMPFLLPPPTNAWN